jgi:UDP-N-acetylmuramate--alanine ligase
MQIKKAYFVGIGGIGMSALAQYLAGQGAAVSGSDRSASPTTELLESEGISVFLVQKAENVPGDADTVIYSEAVPRDNPERARARELGIREISYFEALGEATRGKKVVAISGTHGKTTTTGMVAKILADAGAKPYAIVGSIVKDFGSNYLKGDSDIFVVEACEYKGSFLSLSPHILVITNIEWDHTDFYPTLASVQDSFRQMVEKVPEAGAIVTNVTHKNISPILAGAKWKIVDYTTEPAYEVKMLGAFNVMNARAAAAAARAVLPSISDESIRNSLRGFHGTWRRFEYKGKTVNGADVYDDYAHHPTAVKLTLEALRAKTSGKIIVAFHPHLYSRTRDLLDEFSTAFAGADEVIIAPIYAAREVDDGTISNKILAERISTTGTPARALNSFDEIKTTLEQAGQGDTVVTMGAGDIYKVADELVKM